MIQRRKTIKQLRSERDMTQLQLAFHTGLSLSTLSEIEAGKRAPRLDTMRKIAGALGVDFRDIAWDAADMGDPDAEDSL